MQNLCGEQEGQKKKSFGYFLTITGEFSDLNDTF
jgi:hypothetical protein